MGIKVFLKTTTGHKIDTTISGDSAVIGRSVKCDVVVQDESLSRQHCQVDLISGEFYVTDLGSANGVFINGSRIEANTRTHFAGFNQLFLGPLECTLEETESASLKIRPQTNPQINSQVGATTAKRISKDDLKKATASRPASSMKKEQPAKRINAGVLAPVILLAGAVYYFMTTETDEAPEAVTDTIETPAPTPAYKKTIQTSKTVSDEFKFDGVYIENKAKANCEEFASLCTNLKLDKNFQEGVLKLDGEAFVYVKPSRHLQEEQFNSLKNDPRAEEILLFSQILPSGLMDEYLEQKVSQLHLVVINSNDKISRVFRLHPSSLNATNPPRMELLTLLAKAISEGQTQGFLEKIDSAVRKKDLSE